MYNIIKLRSFSSYILTCRLNFQANLTEMTIFLTTTARRLYAIAHVVDLTHQSLRLVYCGGARSLQILVIATFGSAAVFGPGQGWGWSLPALFEGCFEGRRDEWLRRVRGDRGRLTG